MNNTHKFQTSVAGMHSNLMPFAMRLTLNEDEARDLVQETTLKALANEDKFEAETNLKGWMLSIMRNIFINNYRKNVRENTMVDTTCDFYHLNVPQDSGIETPDSAVAANEISALLAGFPEEFRQPFSMHVAGYKYEEISKILSMPLGTVKSHIFFTRMRMRELLKDYR